MTQDFHDSPKINTAFMESLWSHYDEKQKKIANFFFYELHEYKLKTMKIQVRFTKTPPKSCLSF